MSKTLQINADDLDSKELEDEIIERANQVINIPIIGEKTEEYILRLIWSVASDVLKRRFS